MSLAGLAVGLALAAGPADPAVLFPDAAPPIRRDGPSRSLQLPEPVELQFVSYAPRRGLMAPRTFGRCGVVVREVGRPAQGVVAIGAGDTELQTCDGLVAYGAAHVRGAIALIYDTRSPNATAQTPVVLARAPGGWRIDEALTQKAADIPGRLTIPAIRRALKARP